jgi:AcrR family transcriptional regulator
VTAPGDRTAEPMAEPRLPEPRAPLSLERVLGAAIGLADDGGLESLTMRKLARELGVEVMSLYYYVAKKDDILDGILELVVGEIEPVATQGTDWRSAIRAGAISAHQALERHPWSCPLWMSPDRVGSGRMRYMESMLSRLREAGFSAELTDRAYHALDSHVIGSTLWQVGYSGVAELPEDFGATFVRSLPLGEYPYLAEHVEQHLSIPEAGETAFEFGLDLILEGLERVRAAG